MSSRVERTIPVKFAKNIPVIVDFDSERLKAPFLLRCGAMLIDYIILVSIPIVSFLLSRLTESDPAKAFNNEITNTGWLIFVLFGITNFLILPLLTGQSLGKMLTRLKIVNFNGAPASFSRLLVRHLIGYPLSLLIAGIGFFLAVFTPNGRALHDLLAGTIVVYGKREKLK